MLTHDNICVWQICTYVYPDKLFCLIEESLPLLVRLIFLIRTYSYHSNIFKRFLKMFQDTMEPCSSANKQPFSRLSQEEQSFSGLPFDSNDPTIKTRSKSMLRSIDIVNVIALLCRKHKISITKLENIITSKIGRAHV